MISVEDIGISIRLIVIWSGYCYLFFNFMGRVLGRIRSITLQLIEIWIKGLVINIICGIFLGEKFTGQIWWELFNSLFVILYSLSVFWVHYYTYYGSFLKVNVLAMFTELNYMVFLPFSLLMVNTLEERQNMFDIFVPFHLVDLLHPFMIAGIFEIEYRIIQKWIPKIRIYEPVHRKTWWTWLLIYVFWGIASTVYGLKRLGKLNIWLYIFPVLFVMLLLAGLIWLTVRYQETVQKKRYFLKAQQEMMQLHYDVILRQAEELERNRREIERQMKSLIISDAGQVSKGRIRQYLTVLTGQYEQIQAGVYCRDMLTDAVLYHMAARFRQQNLPFEFSFQGYDRGSIGEADIVEFLMNVQKTAETEGTQRISLKAGCVKDALIFELSGPVFRELKRLKKQVLPVAVKYSGDIWIQKESSTLCLRLRKGKREAGRK